MASGRMLQRKISKSHDVAMLMERVSAELGMEHGPFAALLFTWCIAHQDVEGRMHGDPRIVRADVFPLVEQITAAHIGRYLWHMHQLGLLIWYQVEGRKWIAFPGFDGAQPGLRKDREPPSAAPHPEKGVPVEPGNCREDAGQLPCISKEKGMEEKVSKSIADPSGSAVGFDFEQVYREVYPRHEGKARGMRAAKRVITTQAKYERWCSAAKNYAAHVAGRASEHIKQFDSFMSCWEEYADFVPTPKGVAARSSTAPLPPMEPATKSVTETM